MGPPVDAARPLTDEASALIRQAMPSYADAGQIDIDRATLVHADLHDVQELAASLERVATERRLHVIVEWMVLPPAVRITWRPGTDHDRVGVFQPGRW